MQLDFGEQDQAKQVNVVDAEPGIPAKVNPVPLRAGRRLRTLTGTLAELGSIANEGDLGDDWLRVRVTEPGRTGLADEVRELLGSNVVDVQINHQPTAVKSTTAGRAARTPHQLFGDYLTEQGVADAPLEARFAELLDELASGDSEADEVEVAS